MRVPLAVLAHPPRRGLCGLRRSHCQAQPACPALIPPLRLFHSCSSDTTMNPCGEPAAEESPYTSASTGSTEADATAAADSATAIIDGAAEDVAADATEDATTADTIEVAA